MTRHPSINPQHRVLRGEAGTVIERQTARYEGMWPYLGRRRD